METLKFIGIIFSLAFIGVLPPGLINMAVAKIALEKDKKNALFAAAGVIVVNFSQALISVFLGRYILRQTSIQTNLLRVGLVVFGILTLYFIIAARRKNSPPPPEELTRKDSHKSFGKGVFIALLNVLPIPYFVLISTQLSNMVGGDYTWPYMLLFSLAAAAGTFSVLYLYIYTFLKLNKRTGLIAAYANYIMAGLMFLLFMVTLIRILYGE